MPAVARDGDSVMSQDGKGYKCQVPMETTTGEFSDKVHVDGKGVVCEGMAVKPHSAASPQPCTTDLGKLTTFSSKVKIGGKGVGRVGDKYTAPRQAQNIISQGSSNVFVGG